MEGLAPHACLETNICCVAASSQSELTDRDKQATDVFEFLMDSIEPKVIYLYGDLPLTYFWGKYGSLNQYEVTELELEYGSVIVYATCHLASRQSGVTHERVRSWARILKQEAAKVL